MVTLAVFSPEQMIISTIPFDSLADAEGLVDDLLADPERKQAFSDIDALCSSSFNSLSRIIEAGSGRETANWIQRYRFIPTMGHRPQLIAALQEYASHVGDPKVSITSSLNGQSVIASIAVESLSTIEERTDQIANDPATIARATAVLAHVESSANGISKVFRV